MKLVRTATVHPALFNVVPLVNVVFLLLIFFALSSTFVLQPGLAVTLPVASFTLGPQRNAHLVSIKAGPVPALYFEDRNVTPEQFETLLGELPAGNRTLIIRADRAIPYDEVMRVSGQGLAHGFDVVLAVAPK